MNDNDVDFFNCIYKTIEDKLNTEFTMQKEKLLKEFDEKFEEKRVEIIVSALNSIKFECLKNDLPLPRITISMEIKK
ncbi:MAG: hypothetical protein NC213_09975 [Acetobacter sp.]|nr:hypothetical protein [Bacteroides sp.]MCM1342060.1 hypothetical protein [Acetobacter sp.]MCM1434254.1 hypothetical protein [Clostridiales bacterium]